jgi:hypothetical protein
MGPGDYKDVEVGTGQFWDGGAGRHLSVDHYKYVEINDRNRNDFRICCLTCGKHTGWSIRDFPNMPGAGADWVRKTWNHG